MVDMGAAPRELCELVARIINRHGLHKVTLALLSAVDDKALEIKNEYKKGSAVDRWTNVAMATVDYEHRVLRILGDEK